MNKCGVSQQHLQKQKKINKQIDDELHKELRDGSREMKILLLGTAGSGKTTFMKQMKIRYGSGYSMEEKQTYTQHIYRNILDTMKVLCGAMLSLGVEYGDPLCELHAETILRADHSDDLERFVELYSTAIQTLGADSGIQSVWTRRSEFCVLDSVGYFLSDINRFCAPDYLPSESDILCVDIPTEGVEEMQFCLDKYRKVRMVDIGASLLGGGIEKWIHQFHDYDNNLHLFFFAGINECDPSVMNRKPNEKTSRELPAHSSTFEWFHQAVSASALDESISLYRKIVTDWFPLETMVLFLNKRDLLEDRLNIGACLPEFPGVTDDGEDQPAMMREFMRELFVPTRRDRWGSSDIYYYHMSATNTECIRFVFRAVMDLFIGCRCCFGRTTNGLL